MVSMKTELALERQKRVVVGVVWALKFLMLRIMAGCCGTVIINLETGIEEKYYTHEWHNPQSVFYLVSSDASGMGLF
jgi:hypothetical protein